MTISFFVPDGKADIGKASFKPDVTGPVQYVHSNSTMCTFLKARKGWEEYENMERKLKKKMAEVEKNKKRKKEKG